MKIDTEVTREMFRKGLGVLPINRSATAGMTDKESQYFRAELVKTLYSLRSTQDIITANSRLLTVELKDNKVIQDALKSMGDRDITKTIDSILNKKDIDNKEAKRLVDYMEKFTVAMGSIDASLTVGLPQILDNLSTVINDDTLSVAYRKDYLLGIQKLLATNEVTKGLSKETAAEMQKLTKIQASALNFTEKERETLNWTLTALKEDAKDVKVFQTLKQLDKTLNASVLTNNELKDTLKKQTSSNATLQEMLEKHGGALAQGIGANRAGLVQTGLSVISPELATLFGDSIDGMLGSLISSIVQGKVIKGAAGKGALSKISGLFKGAAAIGAGGGGVKSVLTSIGGVGNMAKGSLGAIGGVLAAGSSIFDIVRAKKDYDAGAVTEQEKNSKQGSAVGKVAGMVAGGKIGATIGTMIVPGLGTALGGIAGGIVGYITGDKLGGKLGGMFGSTGYKGSESTYKKATARSTGMFGFIANMSKGVDSIISNLTGSDFGFTEQLGKFVIDKLQALWEFINKISESVGGFTRNTAAKVGGVVDRAAQSMGITSTAATGKGMTNNESAAQAMAFFQKKGWTKEQAAGIVGNLQTESGNFSADVVSGKRKGDNGRAVGVAQWHPDRQAKFKKLYGKDIQGASLQEQLEFVNWELNNSEKGAGDNLRNAKTAGQSAYAVDKYYERSSGEHRQQRINNAYSLIGGQSPSAANTPSSKTSTAKAKAVAMNPSLSKMSVTPTGQIIQNSSMPSAMQNVDSAELVKLSAPQQKTRASTGAMVYGNAVTSGRTQALASAMAPTAPANGGVNNRRLVIDDYGLAIANSLMFG